MILKGPVKFSESFSSRTLLSAPFRNPVDPYSAICNDHTYIHTYCLSIRKNLNAVIPPEQKV